jgi:hypothetical protein
MKYYKTIDYVPLKEELEQSRQERREVKILIMCVVAVLAIVFGGEVLIRMAEAGKFNNEKQDYTVIVISATSTQKDIKFERTKPCVFFSRIIGSC